MASQITEKCALEVDTDSPFVAQVIRVLRVTPSETYSAVTGLDLDAKLAINKSVYDVLLSDGHYTRKFVIAPVLFPLLKREGLPEGCLVRVTDCVERFDERLKSGKEQFFIIKELEVLHEGKVFSTYLRRTAKSGKLTPASAEVGDWEPLGSGRSAYEDLLEDTVHPDDPRMRPNKDKFLLTAAKWDSIKAKAVAIASLVPGSPYDPHDQVLVARIVRKTHVQCFAKVSRRQSYPFNTYYILEDSSAKAVCVAWNFCSLEYQNSFEVGDVVVVEGFRLRELTAYCKSFGEPDCKLELSVNHTNPEGMFWLVPEGNTIPEDLSIPPLSDSFNFVARADFPRLKVGELVDVAGVIVRVGRPRLTEFLSRLVVLVDPTSTNTICLRVYDRGQHENFDTLQVGMMFVARNCRLSDVGPTQQTSHTKRHYALYVDSGGEYFAWFQTPQVDPKTRPFFGVPEVDEVADWIAAKGPRDHVLAGCTGGYFSTHLATGAPYSDLGAVTPLKDVAHAIDTDLFHLHEDFYLVQGSIASIVYTDGEVDETLIPLADLQDGEGDEGAAGGADADADATPPPPKKGRAAGSSQQQRAGESKGKEGASKTKAGAGGSKGKQGKAPEQLLWRLGEGVELIKKMPADVKHIPTCTTQFLPELVTPPASKPGFWKITLLGLNKDVSMEIILVQKNSHFMERSPLDVLEQVLPLGSLGVSPDAAQKSQRERITEILLALHKQRFLVRIHVQRIKGQVEIVAEKVDKRGD